MTKEQQADWVELIYRDLRFRERLLQTNGLTWEDAARCVSEAFEQWCDADRIYVQPTFVGESGYTKRDEL